MSLRYGLFNSSFWTKRGKNIRCGPTIKINAFPTKFRITFCAKNINSTTGAVGPDAWQKNRRKNKNIESKIGFEWRETIESNRLTVSGGISLSKACKKSSWSAWICSIFGFFTEFIIADEAGYTALLALQLVPLMMWPEFWEENNSSCSDINHFRTCSEIYC